MAMKSPTRTKQSHREMLDPQSPGSHSGVDIEAELGIHPVRRPTGIDQDVNELGQQKRVSSVLTSPVFKEELETVVTDLLRSGDGGGHVIAKEIANMLSPMSRSQYSLGVGCVTPIYDITGSEATRYSKTEKQIRCKLAALYRLVDLNGWSEGIYNHISYKVDKEQEHFLINPFGLLYHEVSASKLMKINMQGDVIDQGTTTFILNRAGFIIHSAIHSGRPDLNCVIHAHIPDCVAVSIMECGLLPVSQEALIIGDVSYHNFMGLAVDLKERKMLIKHMGPNNKVMFLRNHGLLVCGETIEEAFHLLNNVVYACEIQVKLLSCVKLDKVTLIDKAIRSQVFDSVKYGKDQMNGGDTSSDIKWEVGEMEFEAHMRMLDNMGYRSGYTYKNLMPSLKRSRLKGDVEISATVQGNVQVDDIQEARSRLQSYPPNSRWINSPNQYTKISQNGSGPSPINGDVSPKNKTKWRNDEGSSHSTPIRISDPNQFVPKNTDPREVAEKRKQIRAQGRWDERGPGPQSQKLEGVHPPDSSMPLQDGVFTGSKGIIQRDYHSTTIVTGPPNPFASMSEEELEKYKQEVAQKSKKDSEGDEPTTFHVYQEETEHTIEVVTTKVSLSDETDGNKGAAESVVQDQYNEDVQNATVVTAPEQPKVKKTVLPVEVLTAATPESVSINNNNKSKIEDKQEPEVVDMPHAKDLSVKEEPKLGDKKKTNGKEGATMSPSKVVEKEDGDSAHVDEGKHDDKGKHKNKEKKQKRRSLSFLKKKEKKEKA
ncbi:alpha-adducin-like isoform X2 [Styela clava]